MRRDRAVAGSVSHRPARRHPYGGAPENVLAVARGPSVNIPPNEPHHQSACLPRAKAAPVLLRTTPCVPSRKRIHTTMKNPSASPSHSQAWTAQPTKQSEGKEKSCHQRQRWNLIQRERLSTPQGRQEPDHRSFNTRFTTQLSGVFTTQLWNYIKPEKNWRKNHCRTIKVHETYQHHSQTESTFIKLATILHTCHTHRLEAHNEERTQLASSKTHLIIAQYFL